MLLLPPSHGLPSLVGKLVVGWWLVGWLVGGWLVGWLVGGWLVFGFCLFLIYLPEAI